MAVAFVQSLGTGSGSAGATTTTISFSGGTKPAVGECVIVAVSRDNALSDPANTDTVTDSNSNFYFRVRGKAGSTTTAAGGVVGMLFMSYISTTWSAGTNTITWTHSSQTARAMLADHFTGVGGYRLGTGNDGSTTVGASISVTTGATNPANGDLVYGMVAAEYGSNAAPTTTDADTTNGSWSATTFIGNGTSSVSGCKVSRQYKIVNASGAQTFGPIGGFGTTTNVDVAGIVASFLPAPAAISTFTDGFTTFDTTTVWTNVQGTPPTVVAGKLRFVTENTYADIRSQTRYSLMGSSLYLAVYLDNTANTTREFKVEFRLGGTTSEMFQIYHAAADPVPYLGFQRYTASSATSNYVQPYVEATHRWWRFRESAGTVNLDTSADGSSWTSQMSFDLNTLGWQPADMQIYVSCGYYGTEAEPIYQDIDNINIPPAFDDVTPLLPAGRRRAFRSLLTR